MSGLTLNRVATQYGQVRTKTKLIPSRSYGTDYDRFEERDMEAKGASKIKTFHMASVVRIRSLG